MAIRFLIKLKKKNKKSVIGNHEVSIAKGGYVPRSRYNEPYLYRERDHGGATAFDQLTFTKTNTKKISRKREYRDIDTVLKHLEDDYNGTRNQFPWS